MEGWVLCVGGADAVCRDECDGFELSSTGGGYGLRLPSACDCVGASGDHVVHVRAVDDRNISVVVLLAGAHGRVLPETDVQCVRGNTFSSGGDAPTRGGLAGDWGRYLAYGKFGAGVSRAGLEVFIAHRSPVLRDG